MRRQYDTQMPSKTLGSWFLTQRLDSLKRLGFNSLQFFFKGQCDIYFMLYQVAVVHQSHGKWKAPHSHITDLSMFLSQLEQNINLFTIVLSLPHRYSTLLYCTVCAIQCLKHVLNEQWTKWFPQCISNFLVFLLLISLFLYKITLSLTPAWVMVVFQYSLREDDGVGRGSWIIVWHFLDCLRTLSFMD